LKNVLSYKQTLKKRKRNNDFAIMTCYYISNQVVDINKMAA